MARKASRFPRDPVVSGIRSMTHDGRGVADVEGKTVFVDGALTGETVSWRRVRRKRNYDEAQCEAVIEPAADRVTPRCPVYGRCGGCVMQHMTKEGQLSVKQDVLSDNFERIGRVAPARWLTPLASAPWHYRRRARLGVRYVDAKQRVLVGFRERYKPYIVDMDGCPVLVEPVDALIAPLAELIAGLSIARRLPQVEVAVGDSDDGPVTTLTLRVLDPPTPDDRARLSEFCDAHGCWIWLQAGSPEALEPLARGDGQMPPPLEYRLPAHDVTIRFGATDFIQVNAAMNEAMIDRALALLEPRPDDRVLDLFCGIGNFSLPIARRAGSVIGVEVAAGQVARARQNAEQNGIGNTEFRVADLDDEDTIRSLAGDGADLVLLDPARAGAAAFAAAAASFGARRIVYVSCHPGTLARDAGELVRGQGFTLTAAGIMDMFPHTAHVESVAVFDRAG